MARISHTLQIKPRPGNAVPLDVTLGLDAVGESNTLWLRILLPVCHSLACWLRWTRCNGDQLSDPTVSGIFDLSSSSSSSPDGRFKCRVKSVNLFGLYRQHDIETLLQSAARAVEPFVAVDTVVVELMDLSTDKSHRHLSIRAAPAPPSKLDLEAAELFG